MNTHIVSIGLPVYNGENYLKEAIDSIISQTFVDFELIISDNGSTDKTKEICTSFVKKDLRIRYHRNEKNMGGAWNFNHVFHLSNGKYFIWACHDDVWNSTLLERYVEKLYQMPHIVLCYSKTMFINENGEAIYSVIGRPNLCIKGPHRRFRMFLKYHSPPNECSQVLGLFRAEILRKTPLIGKYPSSDMILLGELSLLGKLYEVQDFLLIRRDHPLKSTNAYPSIEEMAVWFDPSQKGKIQLTSWRWSYEWLKSILRTPIGIIDRTKCFVEVFKWAWGIRIIMKEELKRGVKKIIYAKTYV